MFPVPAIWTVGPIERRRQSVALLAHLTSLLNEAVRLGTVQNRMFSPMIIRHVVTPESLSASRAFFGSSSSKESVVPPGNPDGNPLRALQPSWTAGHRCQPP